MLGLFVCKCNESVLFFFVSNFKFDEMDETFSWYTFISVIPV